MKTKEIIINNAPAIEGLNFRGFSGESDFPLMLNIIEKAKKADKDDRVTTLEDIQHDYAHLTNSDPEKDMIFAEINDDTIAYSRVEWWQEEDPNDRIYSHFVNILPKWRNQGIEESLIQWCEKRLKAVAQAHPQDSKRLFQTYSSEQKTAYNEILKTQSYEAARYFIEMSRSLDDIPEAKLPDGIEVRPVRDEDTYKIWRASVEAFRDHWGFSEPKDKEFISYKESKYFQPDLWQVAWDGDEVVSSVMNFIEHDYNEKNKSKRGWTENISTRREWRRRGIARALIVRSMHMHKAKGMTEVALGVDTKNPNGALRLYQSLGYEKDKTHITYRKAM
ncbi:MAG: GNAT family N-acetyltransferase [Chloroflexota bacterium]|jgi:ribosomal protein S18 acetylase RimI-like enzyme|nr:GNAT family N-acetyltransferase [Chloroflexota bacterium]